MEQQNAVTRWQQVAYVCASVAFSWGLGRGHQLKAGKVFSEFITCTLSSGDGVFVVWKGLPSRVCLWSTALDGPIGL